MGLKSAFKWLRLKMSIALVFPVNEQAINMKRSTLMQVCVVQVKKTKNNIFWHLQA